MSLNIRHGLRMLAIFLACAQAYGQTGSYTGECRSNAQEVASKRAGAEYEAVRKRLFPVDPHPEQAGRERIWRFVVFRTSTDMPPAFEEQLCFERHFDGTVHLEVSRAVGAPIPQQLEDLYLSHPDLTTEGAARSVRISRRSFDGQDVPQLRQWSSRIEQVHIPALINAEIYVHGGAVYDVWAFGAQSTFGGFNCLSLTVTGPGRDGKQPNALISLVEEIRRELAARDQPAR
jgi:hypothetical protein